MDELNKRNFQIESTEDKNTGNLVSLVCRNQHGQLEAPGDFPAEVKFYPSGNVRTMGWYRAGKMHRENDQPARLNFFDTDSLEIELAAWWQNGQRHRDGDLPCTIMIDRDDSCVRGLQFYQYGCDREDEGLPSYVWIEPDGSTVDEDGYPIDCDLSRLEYGEQQALAVKLPPFLGLG